MRILPALNCKDLPCLKKHLAQATDVLLGASSFDRWIHIDVADGGAFTHGVSTWNNPEDLKDLNLAGAQIEVHLMVGEADTQAKRWLESGVISRLIFHFENTLNIEQLVRKCTAYGIEPVLGLTPQTTIVHASAYLGIVKSCLLLDVTPGKSGEAFNEQTLANIRLIKERFPAMYVEVDGGITPETAALCKQAGADALATTSAIFSAPNPVEAYKQLTRI